MTRVMWAVLAALVSIAGAGIKLAIEHSDGVKTEPVSADTRLLPETPERPTSTETTEPEPPVMGGDIFDVEMSSGQPCCTFSVGVELEGLKGEESVLSVVVLDANSGEELGSGDVTSLVAEADRDRARTDAEVPIDYAGTYVVRFILYDPDGVELDRAETDPFDVQV